MELDISSLTQVTNRYPVEQKGEIWSNENRTKPVTPSEPPSPAKRTAPLQAAGQSLGQSVGGDRRSPSLVQRDKKHTDRFPPGSARLRPGLCHCGLPAQSPGSTAHSR